MILLSLLSTLLFTEEQTMFTTSTNQTIELLIGGRSNAYLIRNAGKTMLIDTSTAANRTRLDERLTERGISTIDYLVITHIHYDHIENARHIADRYGAKIVIHESAEALVENHKNEPIQGNFFLTRLLGRAGTFISNKKGYEPFTADIRRLDDFDLGELGFSGIIIGTPGHTAYSISVVLDNEIALVGDTLFGIFPNSVMPPYATNRTALKQSWLKLQATGARIFLPGHGKPISRDKLDKAL